MNKSALILPISISLAAMVVVGCGPKDPPTSTKELRKDVIKAVQWSPSEVSNSDNGWSLAEESAKEAVTTLDSRTSDTLEVVYELCAKPLPGDFIQRAEKQVATYDKAFSLMKQAVEKPEWYPKPLSDSDVPTQEGEDSRSAKDPIINKLNKIAKALYLQATIETLQGKRAEAIEHMTVLLKMGQKMMQSNHTVDYHFTGSLINKMGTDCVQRNITLAPWTDAELVKLSEAVGKSPDPEFLLKSLRYEFEFDFVRMLASLPSPKKSLYMPSEDPKVKEAINKIMAGHPSPYDRRATARDASKIFVDVLENLKLPLDKQKDLREEFIALEKGVPADLIVIYKSGNLPEKFSSSDQDKLKAEVKKVENPVGKILIVKYLPKYNIASTIERKAQANVLATQTIIAIARYRLANKKDPATLDELVKAKLLESLPTDPFEPKPFIYDPAKRTIASAGPIPSTEKGPAPAGAVVKTRTPIVWSTIGAVK